MTILQLFNFFNLHFAAQETPFRLTVVTDDREDFSGVGIDMDEAKGVGVPLGTMGFSLEFFQQPCFPAH